MTASTSYKVEQEVVKERKYLLPSGKRFHDLDFSRAPWADIKGKLRQVDWSTMEALAKTDVTAAHAIFVETISKAVHLLQVQQKIEKEL